MSLPRPSCHSLSCFFSGLSTDVPLLLFRFLCFKVLSTLCQTSLFVPRNQRLTTFLLLDFLFFLLLFFPLFHTRSFTSQPSLLTLSLLFLFFLASLLGQNSINSTHTPPPSFLQGLVLCDNHSEPVLPFFCHPSSTLLSSDIIIPPFLPLPDFASLSPLRPFRRYCLLLTTSPPPQQITNNN